MYIRLLKKKGIVLFTITGVNVDLTLIIIIVEE